MTESTLMEELSNALYEKASPTLQWLECMSDVYFRGDYVEAMVNFLDYTALGAVRKLEKGDLWALITRANSLYFGRCMQDLTSMEAALGRYDVVRFMSDDPKLRFLQIAATAALASEVMAMAS